MNGNDGISGMVFIRFECGKEDRIGPELGPYEFIQITYDCIRAFAPGKPDDEIDVAHLGKDGHWITEDGQRWSDFIVGYFQESQRAAPS
jgi:hypothetical protein